MTTDDLRKKLLFERQRIDELLTLLNEQDPPRRAPRAKTDRRKIQRRKSLHWTQRPENKAKLKATVARMTAARMKKG